MAAITALIIIAFELPSSRSSLATTISHPLVEGVDIKVVVLRLNFISTKPFVLTTSSAI